ncbi:hypothetical protein EI42_06425 [Thermosporothrix hazakensis]|uniref:Uncharacterized protein n=1 Tax=Thermosporothrix hazakensis TaxID=644383 RepID=A0A326TZI2_THEHA|nr:hypothetical protein [Thermosporothrix hazakensis]PZW18018.1 hypothetical protein EI42_06425 [Thermosporothrix hazakensis]GCE50487.1 hypothetical protein KTH_53560 [Thermosporothrix hazakensis]
MTEGTQETRSNIFRLIIDHGVRYRTLFDACQERKLISALSCASGGAMPKERAERLLALLNELTKATSTLDEVDIPIRPHLSRAEVEDKLKELTLFRLRVGPHGPSFDDLERQEQWFAQRCIGIHLNGKKECYELTEEAEGDEL